VIPVADKEYLADFVELDRGQALSGSDQLLDFLPPTSQMILAWRESTGKIQVTAHAAHNPVQRHLLESQIAHLTQLQFRVHIIEAQ
jgi:hypothetical protein